MAGGLDRTGNLLGALALAVGDRTEDSIGAAAGSQSAAAALSAMVQFLDRPSVDLLRRVLGLTSSGAVRMIDRLEEAGLVTREPGDDARVTAIVLTPAGRRAGRRVARARGRVLESALAGLEAQERADLDRLLGRVLVGMIRGKGATGWMCRLCDLEACGRDAGRCPVANATGAVGTRP